MILVQVLTPSVISVFMFLVGDINLFKDPFQSPTLPLLVVVAFCMQYTFWQNVGKAVAAKLFAVRTGSLVDVLFIRLPTAASPCTILAAIL